MELSKILKFDPKQRRLRCVGHILNLIAEAYLFGQDSASFEKEYKAAGAPARRQLWRNRGELGKLHNLVAHVMASGKRTELFIELQKDWNQGNAVDRSLKLVLDGGIRWNASYAMVTRALLLREALDRYATKLRVSEDADDLEVYEKDYLSDAEWSTLELISKQLEPLFRITKALEGNTKLNEGAGKPSHGALWEVLPVFEGLLAHFESLQRNAVEGGFGGNTRIQQSITLAWTKAQEYYVKTDLSVAWQASLVLHPRWKWQYFEEKWTGTEKTYVVNGKKALKQLWEKEYKSEPTIRQETVSPEPEAQIDYLENMLNGLAPTVERHGRVRTSSRKDQLAQYLEEPVCNDPPFQYWKSKQAQWPQLAAMAFDFLAVPAMSSECERVFSSCSKQTTAETSNLSGEMLWHRECLKNWDHRGAIDMMSCHNAVWIGI